MNLSSDARRALTRHYKENARPAGVFVVRNLQSGRVYVSGSLDVEGAMNRARFETIDRVKERPDDAAFDRADELQKLLTLWQEELQCFGPQGYNTP
jgi:hypothetical protein